MMMQFICSFPKRKQLSFTQLQIKMVLLFLLTIYAVTATKLDNEDAMKVIELEKKQKQWIKEHQYILNLQTPFLNDMLDLESQDIDLEIVNENVQKNYQSCRLSCDPSIFDASRFCRYVYHQQKLL